MSNSNKGRGPSLDRAIPLYIERVLAEETCYGDEGSGMTNEGWLDSGQIAQILAERYGIKCSREVIHKKFMPDIERYYATCSKYEGAAGSIYQLHTKKNGNGVVFYKLTTFIPDEYSLAATIMGNDYDVCELNSKFSLWPYGLNKRIQLEEAAQAYEGPGSLNGIDFFDMDTPVPEEILNVNEQNNQLTAIRRAIRERRKLVCTKKIYGWDYESSDYITQSFITKAKEIEYEYYELTEELYPVALLPVNLSPYSLIAISLSCHKALAKHPLPLWIESPNQVELEEPLWPSSIQWPDFKCIPIGYYESIKVGTKIKQGTQYTHEKINRLARLSRAISCNGIHDKPVLARIRINQTWIEDNLAFFEKHNKEWEVAIKRYKEALDNGCKECTEEEYELFLKHQPKSIEEQIEESIEKQFGHRPLFQKNQDGSYQFAISGGGLLRWCDRGDDRIQVLAPKEHARAQQKRLKQLQKQ